MFGARKARVELALDRIIKGGLYENNKDALDKMESKPFKKLF